MKVIVKGECNTPKIWYSERLNKLSGCYGDWYPFKVMKERDKVNIRKIQPRGVLKFTFIPKSIKVRPKRYKYRSTIIYQSFRKLDP